MMDEIAYTLISNRTEHFYGERDAIAAALHKMANEVAAKTPPTNMRSLQPDFGRSAGDIIHTVMWGVANLHLDGLTRDAAELDALIAAESDDA
jgi:hypothetical protein